MTFNYNLHNNLERSVFFCIWPSILKVWTPLHYVVLSHPVVDPPMLVSYGLRLRDILLSIAKSC